MALAANLRRLRIARRLSLSELARVTAMSKATLSGIEHGRANPTVDTLASLASALGVPIAELIEPAPLGEMRIVRASEAVALPADEVGRRVLDAVSLEGNVELFELALPARRVQEVAAHADGSRCQVLVLEGTLIAGPVERISELAVGDYTSFPADVPHVYEAGRAPVRALVLEYAPG
ncbi:MAG TPA: helix-turn-helix domain-containing protein [Solirubrobacteraceae bacterium]|nr:helix-turn-helix domain-containing protein [Solirubrobacteraceae bacterium]